MEKELLQEAVLEIKALRRQNEIMGARLEMFDTLMLLFKTSPDYGARGMGLDLVWKIEERLKELERIPNQDPGGIPPDVH